MAGLYALAAVAYDTGVRATGVGTAIGIGRIGAILSPTLAGALLDNGWTPTSLYIAVGSLFVVTALLLWVVRLSPAVGLDVDQVDRDPAVGEQDRGGGAREAAADRLQLLDGQLLADTWGFEVRPNEFDVAFQPLHQVAIPHITVPFLIAHGENDRQIPLEYAHRSYDQAVNSPKRKLRVFTPEEGATEHIGLDHLLHVSAYVADWIADTFAELAASKS